jgi:hypothetical protein
LRIPGNLTGKGVVVADGADQGEVDYDIDVFHDGAMKTAEGAIEGDMPMLAKAQSSRTAQLRLETGSTISIILTLVRADGSGTLQVSGPLPGF